MLRVGFVAALLRPLRFAMDPSWFPSADRPKRISDTILVPFMLVCISSLLLPRGAIRLVLTLPPILFLVLQARRTTSGNNVEDYLFAVNASGLLYKYITFVVFRKPETDMWRVQMEGENKGKPDEEVAQEMDLWSKFKWSLHFWTTLRGVGWNWQVRNVDTLPDELRPKSAFIKAQLWGMLRCYIAIDLLGHFIRASPYGLGVHGQPLLSDTIPRQILLGWLNAIRSYFELAYPYHFCALLSVALNMSSTALWPPLYGDFTHAWSIRKLWGYCWHQNCRRLFEGPTSFIVEGLGIRRGSFASRYLQLYLSFFVSALIHHIGSLNTPYIPEIEHQFAFFMMQPIAITLEDFVQHIGKKLGIKPSPRTYTLGYIWVLCFLSFSLRYAASYAFVFGAGALENPLVWSVADRVLPTKQNTLHPLHKGLGEGAPVIFV